MKKTAIHQPYFLPWLGYFHKLSLVDEFIYFDNVQMPNMRYYISRVEILLNKTRYWLGIPIKRGQNQIIKNVSINFQEDWKRKHIGTLKQAYGKTDHFDEIFTDILGLYNSIDETISEFDQSIIKLFHKASERIEGNELKATDMIIEVCKKFNVECYVAGKGPSLAFLEIDKFNLNNISIEFQEFTHPIYAQKSNEFIPGLSILDSLFNLGYKKTEKMIKGISQ
jgi:hypothetical protein